MLKEKHGGGRVELEIGENIPVDIFLWFMFSYRIVGLSDDDFLWAWLDKSGQ